MSDGLLVWGQRTDPASGYNANDDRMAITALAGYGGGIAAVRHGVVRQPTFSGTASTSATLGPWLALADCGDNTVAAIGNRGQTQITVAGSTAAVTRYIFADIDAEAGTWNVTVVTGSVANRDGVLLGHINVQPGTTNTNQMVSHWFPEPSRGLGPQGMIARYTVVDTTRRNATSYSGAASVCQVTARMQAGRQYQIRGGTPAMQQDTSGALRTFHAQFGQAAGTSPAHNQFATMGRQVRVGRLAYGDLHPLTCEYVGTFGTGNRTFDVRFWLGSDGHFIPGADGHRLWITVEDVGPAPG